MGRPKIDLTKKAAKYAVAIHEGKKKREAKIIAGYSQNTDAVKIESQEPFKQVQRYFAEEFKSKMTVAEVADALIDNIRQDGETRKDRGARNRAIEIALERVEPQQKETTEERVLVVLAN